MAVINSDGLKPSSSQMRVSRKASSCASARRARVLSQRAGARCNRLSWGNPTKKQFQVWTPAESDNVHDSLKPHQINFSQAAGPVPCRIGFPGSQLPLFLLPVVQTTRGTIYRNIQIPNAAFAWITCWKINNNLPHFDKFKSLFALNTCYHYPLEAL